MHSYRSDVRRLPFTAGLLILVIAAGRAGAADAPGSFDAQIRPLLNTYCLKCHGEVKPKHGVNLARFGDVASIYKDPKLWRTVLAQLNERAMPPDDKPQPSAGERAL